jgi:hypothetical protein
LRRAKDSRESRGKRSLEYTKLCAGNFSFLFSEYGVVPKVYTESLSGEIPVWLAGRKKEGRGRVRERVKGRGRGEGSPERWLAGRKMEGRGRGRGRGEWRGEKGRGVT